jgi:predicted molibdopterin-dependent oxidoreductase YjgC
MSRRSRVLTDYADQSYVLMHPEDARTVGVDDGEQVRLVNSRGNISTTLRLSEGVTRGELFAPFHFRETPVNSLTRADLDPESKIAPFKLSACRVERE